MNGYWIMLNVLFASIKMITCFFLILFLLLITFFLCHILEFFHSACFVFQKSLLQIQCRYMPWIPASIGRWQTSLTKWAQSGLRQEATISAVWVMAKWWRQPFPHPSSMGFWSWQVPQLLPGRFCSVLLQCLLPPSWVLQYMSLLTFL